MNEIALFGMKKMLGGNAWKTVTPSLLPADVMALRTTGRQYKKLEHGESLSAVLQEKQVMEGPLWELISPKIGTRETTCCRERMEQGQQIWTVRRTFLLPDAERAVRNFREFRQHPI